MSFSNPNSNNNQGYYYPETQYPVNFKNPKSKLSSEIYAGAWRGSLFIGIAMLDEKGKDGEPDTYNRKDAVKIYLNPAKAMIFAKQLELYRAGKVKSAGVTNMKGNTQIFITKDKSYFGTDGDVIVIRKFDADGTEKASAAYELNNSDELYFGIQNIDITKSTELDFNYFDNIELTILENTIRDYGNGNGFAISSCVTEAISYRLDFIYNACKGDGGNKNGNGNGASGSFFASMAGRNKPGDSKPNQDEKNYGLDDLE